MDFSTLQSRTRSRLNIGVNDPVVGDTSEIVNEALHYLETASPDGWPWMRRHISISLTANTSSVTFTTLGTTAAATVGKVLGAKILRSTVYDPLRLMGPEEAAQLYPSTTTRCPEAWFVEGQTLYFYPTPDATYTVALRVLITETDLGGSTSTPVLPVVFHSAVVDTAAMLGYQAIQDAARAAQYEQKVAGWVQRMARYGREYAGGPKIKVRSWL